MGKKNNQKEEQFVMPESGYLAPEPAPSSKTAALVEKIIGAAGLFWVQNLMIFLVVIAAYGHTLTYPFYFDDFTSIVDNKAIQDLGNLNALWNYAPLRVIGYATFALNYHFHGLDVFGYHLLNIFIHTLTGCAILFFCQRLTRTPVLSGKISAVAARWLPLITALLFVLHPLQVQAVTYIVQRLASLTGLFYISALSCYVQARISMTDSSSLAEGKKISSLPKISILFTLLFSLLAIFTKQNSATLPLAFILVELVFFRLSPAKLLRGILILTLSVSALYLIAVFILHYQPFSLNAMEALTRETKTISRIAYLATQTRVLWTYIRLFFLPIGLHIDHDVSISQDFSDISVLIATGGHILLLLLAWKFARRQPLLSFAVLFFYLANLVESSFIPIGDVLFEHRTYLPNLGLALLVAGTLVSLVSFAEKNKSRISALIIPLLLVLLMIATHIRNTVWQDPVTLWQDCVAKAPDKARPNNNLGKALHENGETKQAIGYFTKALTIWPDYSKAHNNIGLLYVKENSLETAIQHLKAAVAIEPDYENAHNNLGYAYHEKGDWKQAETHYREALRLKPDSIKAHNNLARLLADRGNVSEAIFHLEESLRIEPDYALGQHNIGQLYAQQGDLERAIKHFREAIRINPAHAKAFYNLGLAYVRKGDSDLAAKNFKKALEVNPEYKEAEMSLNLLGPNTNNRKE